MKKHYINSAFIDFYDKKTIIYFQSEDFMRELNINDYIKVKLTDYGYQILEEFYDNLLNKSNEKEKILPENFYDKYKNPEADEEGFTEFRLWNLIQIFGNHFHSSSKIPFESYILIDEKDLKEHKEKKKRKRKALINKEEQNN